MDANKLDHGKKETYSFREPSIEDGRKIWKLIQGTKTLDLNSVYSYLMLSKFFSETCMVAEENHQIIGFVSAFRLPQSVDTIFVWQVAVHESCRGRKIGNRLLNELLQRDSCETVHYLEATISPSNIASQALFKGMAKSLKCPFEVLECFSEDHFPESGHEAEHTYRIGPF